MLSNDNYKDIIAYNRPVIYKTPKKYPNLQYYMETSLKADLLAFYKYVRKHHVIAENQYLTVIDNMKLMSNVRKKAYGKDVTSQHFNLLCALGLIKKVANVSNIEIEQNFFKKNPRAKRPINVYTVPQYTEAKLREIESNAEALRNIGVNLSNFSYNMLCVHGLTALANEVFPLNSRTAPNKKEKEYEQLVNTLYWIVEEQGYCTRLQLLENLAEIDKYEYRKLLKIFKQELNELFTFKRPTKDMIEKYNLNPYLSIYQIIERI